MLTISKPLSAGQAQRYHGEEFQNARENYYTEGEVIRGVWYGELASRWCLAGEVREEHFQRLAEGQHPITGEQLVRHQTARETTKRGERATTIPCARYNRASCTGRSSTRRRCTAPSWPRD